MGNDEDIKFGEYAGKDNDEDNDEEEGQDVVVYAIVLWGANGDWPYLQHLLRPNLLQKERIAP